MRKPFMSAVLAGALTLGAGVVGVAGTSAAEAAPARPNLVVSAVKWAPVATVAGQQVRFSATITNRGNAATPAGIVSGVGFAVDGALRTWSDTWTSAIAPGASVTVTANGGPSGSAAWTATAGRHTLRAHVDDANRIGESREDDNILTVAVDVAPGLTVRSSGDGYRIQFPASTQPGVVTTSVTGDAYAGCVGEDGAVREGSEQYLTTFTVGRDVPSYGGKWFDGEDMVAAGVTRLTTHVSFSRLLYSNQGHFPFDCPTGTAARWTSFQAASVTVTRWPGKFGDSGPQLARVTRPSDAIFAVVP